MKINLEKVMDMCVSVGILFAGIACLFIGFAIFYKLVLAN